jgi:hypothetical protein
VRTSLSRVRTGAWLAEVNASDEARTSTVAGAQHPRN